MGAIGSFGKVIRFEVNANKVLTFKDMKRTVSARWKKHDIVQKKPKSEFMGPDTDEITIKITLSAEHGVKPRKTLEAIEKAIKKGQVEYFIVGGKKVGTNKYYIETMSEDWEEIWNKGELVRASGSITFTEYT